MNFFKLIIQKTMITLSLHFKEKADFKCFLKFWLEVWDRGLKYVPAHTSKNIHSLQEMFTRLYS